MPGMIPSPGHDIEKAVLAYADEETLDIRVREETFKNIRKHFSEEAVVELTTTIAYYGMVCRILETLQIEMEEDETYGFKAKR